MGAAPRAGWNTVAAHELRASCAADSPRIGRSTGAARPGQAAMLSYVRDDLKALRHELYRECRLRRDE
jgi:hypothetical protein